MAKMPMKIIFALAIGIGQLFACSAAQTKEQAPLLLLFPDDLNLVQPGGSGLIGFLSFTQTNKEQAAKIARFHAWLPNSDIEMKARSAFSCMPIEMPPDACRADIDMPRTEEALKQRLKETQSKTGFAIQIQPILIAKGFSLRVPVLEYELVGETLEPRRKFTVLYGTRVPDVLEKTKRNPEAPFKDYWLSGSPGRLAVELDKGLREVTKMLPILVTVIQADGTAPKEWNDLPKGKSLKAAGRARCSGLPCMGVRVFKDTADSVWLVNGSDSLSMPLPLDVGVAMISLDPNAALWNTNPWITFIGY